MEAEVDNRPLTTENVLKAGATGAVLGGTFQKAGQLVTRTQIGQKMVAGILNSSGGQAMLRTSYQATSSSNPIVVSGRTVIAGARQGIEALEKVGEVAGRRMGGPFAVNAERQASRRIGLEKALAHAEAQKANWSAAKSGGVQATLEGTLNEQPYQATTRSGRGLTGRSTTLPTMKPSQVRAKDADGFFLPQSNQRPYVIDQNYDKAIHIIFGDPPIEAHRVGKVPQYVEEYLEPKQVPNVSGKNIERGYDAEFKLYNDILLNTGPASTGQLFLAATEPMCPSCYANLWTIRKLLPEIEIISNIPLPVSGAAGAIYLFVPDTIWNQDFPPVGPTMKIPRRR